MFRDVMIPRVPILLLVLACAVSAGCSGADPNSTETETKMSSLSNGVVLLGRRSPKGSRIKNTHPDDLFSMCYRVGLLIK
jgi:hypothetical protein